MKRTIPVLTIVFAMVLALVTPAFGANGFDGDPATTERVDTANPTTAAIGISNDRFATEHAADYAILSRDDLFADSLAASGLNNDGPLLFTATEQLTDPTRSELDRVLADGKTVYLLGGTNAISNNTEQQVQAEGYSTKRLFGTTRVQTSVAVADEIRKVNPGTNVAALARAFGTEDNPTAAWADSITGGGWAAEAAAPILITPTDKMEQPVKEWLDNNQPSTTYVLGGTAAIQDGVAAQAPNAKRVYGPTRAHTATEIAKQMWDVQPSGTRSYVIIDGYADSGWAFGLAGAGASQKYDAPILVVEPGNTPDITRETVRSCDTVQVDLLLMGSTSVISEDRRQELDAEDGKSCPDPVWDVNITDVLADPAGDDVQHNDGEYVELTNNDSTDAQVGGWYILDKADNRLDIGEGYVIEPGTTLRVYTGPGDDTADRYYNGEDSAILNNDGDDLRLYTADGQLVDTFSY